VEPDTVRWRFGARGVTGECLGNDEKDVRDERLEYVVSLLVYGLADVLEVSRVEGRLRRLRDGVTGDEGVEGIVLIVEVDREDWSEVATSSSVTLLLQLMHVGSDSQVPNFDTIEYKDPREDTVSEQAGMRNKKLFVEEHNCSGRPGTKRRAHPQHMHDRFVSALQILLLHKTHQMDR
jgi:hypothetical protein